MTKASHAMRDAALALAGKGWAVFPAPADGSKQGCTSAKKSNGKRWGATTKADEIENYFRKWPAANVGVPTGPENKIFVVECDTLKGHDKDGIASLRALEAEHGPLPPTLMAMSPTSSPHYYFNWPDGVTIRNSTSKIGPGIDVRGAGGMVLVPPSVRPGEGVYRWLNDNEIADAPAWIIDLATADDDDGPRTPGENPEADPDLIYLAMTVIPNDDVSQDDFNKTGMAIWRATAGHPRGLEAFAMWSQKSKKCRSKSRQGGFIERWNHYFEAPPTQIGAGSIFAWADKARPGWDREYWRKIEDSINTPNDEATKKKQLEWLKKNVWGKANGSSPPTAEASAETHSDEQGAKASAEKSERSQPVDLWGKFPQPELPLGLLPDVIERFAVAESKTMGADVAGLAMGALVVCAAAISDTIKLQVKQHSGSWKESARLWCGMIGDPSTKKSPIFGEVVWPLGRIDEALHEKYLREKRQYDDLPAENKKQREPPQQRRVKIEDTTIEACQEVLKNSPDGVLCSQDEMSAWFGSMDSYASGNRSSAKNRGFWLRSYNGGSCTVDRVGRGSIFIPNLSVCLLGGIQPDVIRKFAADGIDDGLLQRLCPIVLRHAVLGRDEKGDNAGQYFGQLIDKLFLLRSSQSIQFSDGAQEIRRRLEKKHLDLVTFESFHKKLAAHIGKYDGLFARLCLIWHCIENIDNDLPSTVTESTAQRVADFLHKFLLQHAIAFYMGVLGLSDDHDRLIAVAGYILARKLQHIDTRTIQRGDTTMRKMTKRDTDVIIEQLEAFGWVFKAKSVDGRFTYWYVEPEVHKLFAQRAEQEASRRKKAREAIVEMLRGGKKQ